MFLGALVAPFVVQGSSTAQTGDPAAVPKACATVKQHNTYLRHALRFSESNGDYHASRVTGHQLAKLGGMRSCLKHTDRAKYRLARGAWSKRRAKWAFYRHIDTITVYGKWSIPEYIVMRESGGNRCAQNPSSTAGGYYQFLTSTWQAYGGRGSAACAPDWEQHEVAARAWAGGRGSSHWALTR